MQNLIQPSEKGVSSVERKKAERMRERKRESV